MGKAHWTLNFDKDIVLFIYYAVPVIYFFDFKIVDL